MRRLSVVLSGAVLVFGSAGCSPRVWLMRPRVKKVRPRVTGIGFRGVDLEFRVDLRNPNYLRLRTPRFRGGLDVEGSPFLTTDVPVRYDLPARGAATLTLPTRISYLELWRTYKKLRRASEGSYRLHGRLLCTVLGWGLAVPLSRSGKFPVLRAPRFRAVAIRFHRLSVRRLKVTVEAEVMNPNIFEVSIDGLGYALKLGKAKIGGLTASTTGTIGAGETGRVSLTGEVSAFAAGLRLLAGARIRETRLVPTGSIRTPYGSADLDERAARQDEMPQTNSRPGP